MKHIEIVDDIIAAKKMLAELTIERNKIFAQFPKCETPESMPEPFITQWTVLDVQRNVLKSHIDKVTAACSELHSLLAYHKMS